MLQDRKYYAKNDEMLLQDIKEEAGPSDDFKKTHTKQFKKNSVQEKVNNTKYFKDREEDLVDLDPSRPPNKHNCRWTSLEN